MRLLVPLGTLLVVAAAPPAWIVHAPQEPACCLPSAVPANVAMNAGDMIDGAEHSELIPDSIAYRLFFLTVAEPADATPEQRARLSAYLRAAGLQDEDIQSAAPVLVSFKSEYDSLVGQYNDSVRVANETSTQPDLAAFLSRQDELVESTKAALQAVISPEGGKRLEDHVQREKRNMKIAKEAR